MEIQIGEQFDLGAVALEVVQSGACKRCHFFKGFLHCEEHDMDVTGDCGPVNRSDGKSGKFQKVERAMRRS